MNRDDAAVSWTDTLIDRALVLHALFFLALYAANVVHAFAEDVPLFQMPVELFVVMLAPVLARVYIPDFQRNKLRGTIAYCRDQGPALLAFGGLIMLAFASSMRPGAYLAGGETKVVFILGYRFAMFLGGLSLAILLWPHSWRPILCLILLTVLGSVYYELAYPGTFAVGDGRAGGFLGNPNLSALTIAMLLAMVVRYDRLHPFDVVLIVLSFVGLFSTLSRSGMMLFTLFTLNYLYFTGRGRRLRQLVWIPLVAAAVVPVVAHTITVLTEQSTMFDAANAQRRVATLSMNNDAVYETDDIRLNLLPKYMALIDEAVLLGHGTGFSLSMPYGPHNVYLDFWVNNGFIGLIFYVWFVLSLLVLAYKRGFTPGLVFAQIAIFGGFFNHTMAQLPAFLMIAGMSLGISWCEHVGAGAAARRSQPAEGAAAAREAKTG